MKYTKTKAFLAGMGQRCPDSAIHFMTGVLNYIHIGWWFKRNGYSVPPVNPDRESLYTQLADQVAGPVSYLEFGVFHGASMRIWSKVLTDPASKLDGFDSFEGLPEVWRMAADKKTFDVNGVIPEIDDSRITFHKGWFEDTLPAFVENFRSLPQLILHLDADLYSSTKFVMGLLEPYIIPGTILIFDELFDREHELKALDEFLAVHPCDLECIGATTGLTQAAFRVVSRK